MILAARLRLGGVILALTLLHTADQCGFSSGPTIHVGPVFFAARLRLRRVIILLTLVRTVVQRIFSIGPTQLGSVIAAARLRLGRVMFQSPQTYSSLCTITFITPKEARRVRHEKLVTTKMEPSLDPDKYISISYTFDPGG